MIEVVKVDPHYSRPTGVENLLDDPSTATKELRWINEITAQDMCREIVAHEISQAKQHALLKRNGLEVTVSAE